MVLPQLVSELQAYTRGVGTLKIDFRIKFDQQGISKNYVGFVKDYAERKALGKLWDLSGGYLCMVYYI